MRSSVFSGCSCRQFCGPDEGRHLLRREPGRDRRIACSGRQFITLGIPKRDWRRVRRLDRLDRATRIFRPAPVQPVARQGDPDFVTIADIPLLTVMLAGPCPSCRLACCRWCRHICATWLGVSVEDFRGSAVPRRGPGNRRAVFFASLFFTLGFATVFVALGAGASSIGAALRQHMDLLAKAGRPCHHC
jgi:hypothetical protein